MDVGKKQKSVLFRCRMYEKEYPEVKDLVVVLIKKVEEVGAYVNLIEYGGIDGMILLKELSRRRIRNIQSFIKVGRCEVVSVVCIDMKKGYIDLSKKNVTQKEIMECEENFMKSKAVHSVIIAVSEKLSIDPKTIYKSFGWPLYKIYGHAFNGFKEIIENEETVFEKIHLSLEKDVKTLDQKIRKELIDLIKQRYTPKKLKIRCDIELTCFSKEGINAIKEALKTAEDSSEETKIQAKLIAPPLYVLSLQTTNRKEGLELMENALTLIKEKINKAKGTLTIKMAPKIINECDEKELNALMLKSELENAEVSGDDESD